MRNKNYLEVANDAFEESLQYPTGAARPAAPTLLGVAGGGMKTTVWQPNRRLTVICHAIFPWAFVACGVIDLMLTALIFVSQNWYRTPLILDGTLFFMVLSAAFVVGLAILFPGASGRPSVVETDSFGLAVTDGISRARVGWEDLERADMIGAGLSLWTRSRTRIDLNLTGYPRHQRRRLLEDIARRAGLGPQFALPGLAAIYRRIEISL